MITRTTISRRSFGPRALAAVAGLAGLSLAKVSLTEAYASGPVAVICADFRTVPELGRPERKYTNFDNCVNDHCRLACGTIGGDCYGYENYKACKRANDDN